MQLEPKEGHGAGFPSRRACATEAIRDFNWREFAPFGWILAVQLVFLLLAMFLEIPAAMATLGTLTRAIYGDSAIHYPMFYLFLPPLAAIAEGFLYTVPAAVLVPLAIIRTVTPMESPEDRSEPLGHRLQRAWLPSLVVLRRTWRFSGGGNGSSGTGRLP